MALKDLLALADDKLKDIFEKKEADPAKVRADILKRIEKTQSQFASATPVKGKKWFKISNGIVRVALPFEIAGKSEFHVPSERFSDWLGHLKDSVTKGELDKEITQPPKTSTAPATKASRGGGSAGWSEERRARFAASIAARKAQKQAG